MLLRWSDIFKLDIGVIDEEHKKLVVIINELYDNFNAGKHSSTIEGTVNRLIEFSEKHFNSEEEILHQINFPAAKNHIDYHKNFKSTLTKFHDSNYQKSPAAFYELFEFLYNWFMNHILIKDREYILSYKKKFNIS